MKAPINWLKKYVDIDLNNIDDLLHKLTLSGTEVDSVQRQGNWEGIVVGEVLEVSKHPNADRLNLVLVNEYNQSADFNEDGTLNILDIVQIVNIILN